MSRSPSRDRSGSRAAGRTNGATSGGGGGGGAFDPTTSVSNKMLWLRAKDLAGADGSSVTSWTAAAGSNPTAFAGVTVAAGVTPSGGKAVHGTGSGGAGTMNLAALSPGGTTAEIWIVVRTVTAGEHQSWHFGSGSDYYPFSGDSKIYESFATTARKSFTPTMALNTWRLYRNTVTAGTWVAYLDNVQQSTASGQTFGFPATPKLMDSSGCDIAEVLLLDAISDATQVTNLISYFNTEHGLTVT